MKKIFLIVVIIATVTACTKNSPTPQPEPISESYVGYLRSEHPNIKIPGISVNDKIVYDIKTVQSFNFYKSRSATFVFFDKKYIREYLVDFDPEYLAEIALPDPFTEDSQWVVFIPGNIFDENPISYTANYNAVNNSDNIKSIKLKRYICTLGDWGSDTDVCDIDLEITLQNGDIIEIIYTGDSIHRDVIEGFR